MNLRKEARWLWPIAGIWLLGLLCGGYILNKQRLESPLEKRYELKMEFAAVDAVTPGLGAPVTVAGVTVGQIDGVELKEGRGVIRASMDPEKLPAVYADATAALVPNTPLKDMQVRLWPGKQRSRKLPDGSTLALHTTTTPVDASELLRALDSDTREWVGTLIDDFGTGTKGRGRDLNATLKQLGPTAGQLRTITSLLADRRAKIRSLVHDLSEITAATAEVDEPLRDLVTAGDSTLAVLAANDEPIRESLELLPGTLAAAQTTLARTPAFATSLKSTLTELDPTITSARRTLREAPDALRGVVPLPTRELGAFVDATAPLGQHVRSASRDLAAATQPLKLAFAALGQTADQLAYVHEDGRSYLFWMGWFAHNVNSILSTQDAHGAVVRGFALNSCSSFTLPGELGHVLEPIIRSDPLCEVAAR